MKRILIFIIAVFVLMQARAQRPVIIPTPIQVQGYAQIRDSVRASIYFQGLNDTLATQAYVRLHSGAGGGFVTGYGIKISGDTIKLDTSNARKVDSLYTITDSTGIFKINGIPYAFKISGNVKSYNGRIGLVVPQRNDYVSFYPALDSTYSDPSFISHLSWGKITTTPNSLGSYGILDAVRNKGGANTWQVDALSNRPAPSGFGNIFMAIDASDSSIYFDNGTRWVLVSSGSSGPDSAVNAGYGLSKTVTGTTIKLVVDTTTLKTVFGSGSPGVFQIFTKYPGIVINGTDTVDIDTTIAVRFTDTLSRIATRSYVTSRGYITSESDPVANAKTVTINVGAGISRTGMPGQTVGGSPTYTLASDTAVMATLTALADTSAALRTLIGPGSISQLFHKFAGITIRGTDTVDIDTAVVTRFSDTATAKPIATKTYVNAQGFLKSETDPVANAKTLSDSTGYGMVITGLTTQTLTNNPKWKFTVDTTLVLPLHRLADTSTILRALFASGGQPLTIGSGLLGTSYNGSAPITIRVDSSQYYTKYRSDTSRTAIYAALLGKQPSGSYLTSVGNIGSLFTSNNSSGAITFTASASSAYSVYVNGTSGTAVPTFSKLPVLAMASGSPNLLVGTDASGNPSYITAGTNISISAGVISASGGGGGSGVDTIYRTPGKDSIQFTINSRYHSILDSSGAPVGNDTIKITHIGPVWNMFNSVTGDSLEDKGWNTTNGHAYVRTNPDSSNYIVLKASGVTAGAYTKASVTFDSTGRATAASSGVGLDTLYRTPGKDSIQFTINGRYHSIYDSAGGSGGGGGGAYYPPLDSVLWKNPNSTRSAAIGGFKSTGADTLTGITYNATKGKVITQDTVSGILYRQSVQTIDTSGAAIGKVPSWNGSGFVLSTAAFVPDSLVTVTTGTSSTVPNACNIIRFNPSSTISTYTLTLPTTWHVDHDLLICFGGTVSSGNVVTSLTIVAGSGQSLIQSVTPSTGTYGEIIRYHLVGTTIDQRTN